MRIALVEAEMSRAEKFKGGIVLGPKCPWVEMHDG